LSIVNQKGWYWPVRTDTTGQYCRFAAPWLQNNTWHTGQDFKSPLDQPVYAIADGEVLYSNSSTSGYGPSGTRGGAVVIRHKTSGGSEFLALYGHLNNIRSTGHVNAGEIVGYINNYNPNHLHFGIHPGSGLPSDNNPYRGFTSTQGQYYGWVDPIEFLNSNSPN